MKGFIVAYSARSRRVLSQLNHGLLGRIIRVPQKHKGIVSYYYQGVFDDLEFLRLKEGCYFVKGDRVVMSAVKEFVLDSAIVVRADVDLSFEDLVTGREFWNKHSKSKGWKVKNLNEGDKNE
jgi:hypothetical protein